MNLTATVRDGQGVMVSLHSHRMNAERKATAEEAMWPGGIEVQPSG
jgi:hypothetical protein